MCAEFYIIGYIAGSYEFYKQKQRTLIEYPFEYKADVASFFPFDRYKNRIRANHGGTATQCPYTKEMAKKSYKCRLISKILKSMRRVSQFIIIIICYNQNTTVKRHKLKL